MYSDNPQLQRSGVSVLQKLHQQMHACLLVSLQGQTQTLLLPSPRFSTLFHCLLPLSSLCFSSKISTEHFVPLQHVTEHPKHGSPGTANYIDARTTWFDEAVLSARQQGITQVVVIAAGYDTRAYRLHIPGLQVSSVGFMRAHHVLQSTVPIGFEKTDILIFRAAYHCLLLSWALAAVQQLPRIVTDDE